MNYPFLVTFEIIYVTPDGEDRVTTRHHVEAIDEFTAVGKAAVRLSRKLNRDRAFTKEDAFKITSANVKQL